MKKENVIWGILEELVTKCNRCEGGDCYNCGQKPINIEQAEVKIRNYIKDLRKKW